jgi:hypothetical protein
VFEIIEMTALFPFSVIDSLTFSTKILKFGEKLLELWSSHLHEHCIGNNAQCDISDNAHFFLKQSYDNSLGLYQNYMEALEGHFWVSTYKFILLFSYDFWFMTFDLWLMDFVIVPCACFIISKANMAKYDNNSDEVSSFT